MHSRAYVSSIFPPVLTLDESILMAVYSPWTLVGWVLGVLNLCSLGSGFAHHHHHRITKAAQSSASPPAHRRPDRDTALRLASQEEQQSKDDTVASGSILSEFGQTSGPVKAFVGGLTDLFVLLSGGENKEEILPPATPKVQLLSFLRHSALMDRTKLGNVTDP